MKGYDVLFLKYVFLVVWVTLGYSECIHQEAYFVVTVPAIIGEPVSVDIFLSLWMASFCVIYGPSVTCVVSLAKFVLRM